MGKMIFSIHLDTSGLSKIGCLDIVWWLFSFEIESEDCRDNESNLRL